MEATQAEPTPTNGQAQVITREIEVEKFDFTSPTKITLKKSGFSVAVELRRRTLPDILARDKEIKQESEVVARNETVENWRERKGNVVLFDATALSGKRLDAEGRLVREYTREECLRFRSEDKDRFVRQIYGGRFEVLTPAQDGEESDPMFDTPGEAVVRQRLGDPNDPDHVIDYHFNRPEQAVRDRYDECQQLKSKRRGDKPIFSVKTDLRKAYEIGRGLFASADGAIYNSVDDIDPLFILDATRALMAWYTADEESF